MKKIIKYGLPIVVGLVVCLSAITADAQFAINKINNGGLPETSDINTTIVNAVKWFLALVGIISLVVIVWAGVIYMTSGGDEEKVGKAKQRLTYGILGIVVALAGLVIMYAIRNLLANGGETFNNNPSL